VEQMKQQEGKGNGAQGVYKIYSIVEKPGNERNIWLDIGVGRLNRDDSITCKLDCIPINGVIQVRPYNNKRKAFGAGGPSSGHIPNAHDRHNTGGYEK
jgi:hypothetical protein